MAGGETEGQLGLWCPWGFQAARPEERAAGWSDSGCGRDVRAGCCGRQGLESPGMLAAAIQVQSKLEGKKEQGEDEGGEVLGQYNSRARESGREEGIPGKVMPPTRDARRVLSMLAPS